MRCVPTGMQYGPGGRVCFVAPPAGSSGETPGGAPVRPLGSARSSAQYVRSCDTPALPATRLASCNRDGPLSSRTTNGAPSGESALQGSPPPVPLVGLDTSGSCRSPGHLVARPRLRRVREPSVHHPPSIRGQPKTLPRVSRGQASQDLTNAASDVATAVVLPHVRGERGRRWHRMRLR